MKEALVGYTGFVGSNICYSHKFDAVYNSKNITDAFNTSPDLLVFSGLRAEKYLAGEFPEKDLELIKQAEKNIERIRPKKIVLISTIDVFKEPVNVDERTPINIDGIHPYGLHRFYLEKWVTENFSDSLIIRLPGLFGRNIKKNFIYDMINIIPFMLNQVKFNELSSKDPVIRKYYKLQDNGFYKLIVNEEERASLKDRFINLGFTALNFTDSRSRYQFYDLRRVWNDIDKALQNDIKIFHPATEPVSAEELIRYVRGERFVNELNGTPANYDFKTIYNSVFGGSNGYISSKDEILRKIASFVDEYKQGIK